MRIVVGSRLVGALVEGFLGAVLPVQCVGCGAWDEVLCPSCRSWACAQPLPTSLEGARGAIPGLVLGDYSGALRRIILGAKHAARTDVGDFLDEAGATLGASLWRVVGDASSPAWVRGSGRGRDRRGGAAAQVWVVPAPSSWGRRLRGRQVALPLARGVARWLALGSPPGVRVRVVDAVALRAGAGSQ